MQPFTKHVGLVATMDRANVDTDQIIPKQFLKRIERTGFGEVVFDDWRQDPDFVLNDERFAGATILVTGPNFGSGSSREHDGSDDPAFELNRTVVAGASVLVARRNFGCGSSREHAVWALSDYGFQAVIAPSFADIFYNNCFKNNLLPIRFDEKTVEELFGRVSAHPGYRLAIDLEECKVTDERGLSLSFEVDSFRRHRLLEGLDDIALTLEHAAKIAEYESARGLPVLT